MKHFLAVLCSASLLFNGVAVAGGGIGRGLVAEKHGLSKLVSKLTQAAGTLAVTAMLACGMSGCSQDEVADAVRTAERRVATLDYDRSASIDGIIAAIEQTDGAQIGIVKSVDQHGTLVVETDAGSVYVQLAEGEVLINNGATPLKVTLTEEVIDEGWIAEGSLIAIIPAVAVAGTLLVLTGFTAFSAMFDPFDGGEPGAAALVTGIGSLLTATAGLGTYHLILML